MDGDKILVSAFVSSVDVSPEDSNTGEHILHRSLHKRSKSRKNRARRDMEIPVNISSVPTSERKAGADLKRYVHYGTFLHESSQDQWHVTPVCNKYRDVCEKCFPQRGSKVYVTHPRNVLSMHDPRCFATAARFRFLWK